MKATLWEGESLGEKRKGFRGPERGEGSFALLLHLCEVCRAEKRALISDW